MNAQGCGQVAFCIDPTHGDVTYPCAVIRATLPPAGASSHANCAIAFRVQAPRARRCWARYLGKEKKKENWEKWTRNFYDTQGNYLEYEKNVISRCLSGER